MATLVRNAELEGVRGVGGPSQAAGLGPLPRSVTERALPTPFGVLWCSRAISRGAPGQSRNRPASVSETGGWHACAYSRDVAAAAAHGRFLGAWCCVRQAQMSAGAIGRVASNAPAVAQRAAQARVLASKDAHALLAVVEDSLHLSYVTACSALRRLAVFSRRGQAVPVEDPRFQRLERLLSLDSADRLDARGLGSVAWAAAVLRRPMLLASMLSHSAQQLRAASLQEHSLVVWAIGELDLGKEQERCLRKVAHASVALLHDFSPTRLALCALRELPQADGPVALRGQSLRRLHTVNPHCITRLLSGFASCGHAVPRSLIDALGREAYRQLPLFDASGLAFFLAAHAQLGQLPNQLLLSAAAALLAEHVHAAGPDTSALSLVRPRAFLSMPLPNLVLTACRQWSFARLRVHPGTALLDACDASMAQAGEDGLREVSTARLASAVWAWGALDARPATSWPVLTATLSRRMLHPGDKLALRAGLEQLANGAPLLGDCDALRNTLGAAGAPARSGRTVRLPCRTLPPHVGFL